jgi:hypothetical protein
MPEETSSDEVFEKGGTATTDCLVLSVTDSQDVVQSE